MSIRGLSEYFAVKYAQVIVNKTDPSGFINKLTISINNFKNRKDVNDWNVELTGNIQWEVFNRLLDSFLMDIQSLDKNSIYERTIQLIESCKDLIRYIGNSSIFGSGRQGIIKSKELEKVIWDLGHNLGKDSKEFVTWNYDPHYANPMGAEPTTTSDVSVEKSVQNQKERWIEDDIAKQYDKKNYFSDKKDFKADRSESIEKALDKKLKQDARDEHNPEAYIGRVKEKYDAFLKKKLKALGFPFTKATLTDSFRRILPKLVDLGIGNNQGLRGADYEVMFERVWKNEQYNFTAI